MCASSDIADLTTESINQIMQKPDRGNHRIENSVLLQSLKCMTSSNLGLFALTVPAMCFNIFSKEKLTKALFGLNENVINKLVYVSTTSHAMCDHTWCNSVTWHLCQMAQDMHDDSRILGRPTSGGRRQMWSRGFQSATLKNCYGMSSQQYTVLCICT